jgi:hypothetical protein
VDPDVICSGYVEGRLGVNGGRLEVKEFVCVGGGSFGRLC